MNERIRELLSQSGVHYEVMPKDTVYEKFAELIVRECADIAQETRWMVPPSQEQIAKSIRQHFGVE